jgi:hypothetical protein
MQFDLFRTISKSWRTWVVQDFVHQPDESAMRVRWAKATWECDESDTRLRWARVRVRWGWDESNNESEKRVRVRVRARMKARVRVDRREWARSDFGYEQGRSAGKGSKDIFLLDQKTIFLLIKKLINKYRYFGSTFFFFRLAVGRSRVSRHSRACAVLTTPTLKSMTRNWNLWRSMKINKNRWKSVTIHENQ